jgi:WD40 repeat protein
VAEMKKRLLSICFAAFIVIGLCVTIIGLLRLWIMKRTWLLIPTEITKLSQPIERTQALIELSPNTIVNAEEIATLSAPSLSRGVLKMTQVTDNGNLLVIYDNGILRRWNLNTLTPESEFTFLATNSRSVNFSEDGSLVITPGNHLGTSEVNGYTLWNVHSGEIVDCFGPQCPEGWSHLDMPSVGLGLTPNGRWIIDYTGSYIHATGIQLKMAGTWNVDSNPDDNAELNISKIAFDTNGSYIACATEEGELFVFDIENLFNPTGRTNQDIITGQGNGEGSIVQRKYRLYGKYDPNAKNVIDDLSFDDTRTWLAQLTDQELTVWDLRKTFFSRHMSVPVRNGNVVAFSHTGDLLAAGTIKGILLYSLQIQKQIAVFNTGEVTSLYFSRDDRLIIWGDSGGTIHLWGVPHSP